MIEVESRDGSAPELAALVAEVAAGVAASLDASGLELRFVVLDAGTGSHAWTEEVDGAPVSFLAAERFPGGQVGVCLVAHEATHAVHHRVRLGAWPAQAATKLFEEAVAVSVSRGVAPDVSDADAAAFGGRSEAWLAECDEAWPAIRDALLHGGEERYAELFARPELLPDGATLPPRCGYAAAVRIAPALCASAPPAELVRLDAADATALVAAVLERS